MINRFSRLHSVCILYDIYVFLPSITITLVTAGANFAPVCLKNFLRLIISVLAAPLWPPGVYAGVVLARGVERAAGCVAAHVGSHASLGTLWVLSATLPTVSRLVTSVPVRLLDLIQAAAL
jgi:hypothetical protein